MKTKHHERTREKNFNREPFARIFCFVPRRQMRYVSSYCVPGLTFVDTETAFGDED